MAEITTLAAKSFGYLLGGEWRTEGEAVEVRSPFDGSVVGTTFRAGPQQMEAAIAAAVRAFDTTRRLPAYERQRVLSAVSRTVAERREDLARTIALEAGKPIKTARAEVDRAILTFSLAAEESTRIYGQYLPLDLQAATAGRWALVRRFPVGPIAAITPFNFPLNLAAHKIAPALAAGCTMVLKPAPQAPLSALSLAQVVHDAGWPAGALNVLPAANPVAEMLVTDGRLKMLTFTGSAAVGWELKKKAGKKRVTLELGGNAGVIVHSDADIGYAAERCAMGGYSYAGQSCISVQRVLVEAGVHSRFLRDFVPRVQALRLGDPLDEATDVGPMISEDAARRAEQWIQEAVTGGAKLHCGGARRGPLLEPAVLTGTKPTMRVNCEEVFAPVVTVEPYEDFDEALRQVNDSPYGLQAGLFTNDARLIFRAYEELKVGGLMVGEVPTFRIDHMPYGGTKDSGLGREGLRYAIEEMTESRLLTMNLR
ncbi:MAG TPA: aldehyde dehydrogenase family protein [Terriglobales bacterium]|nr:aldehyde dehydrogenase family protein [Terriglobales bacterium]